MAQTDGYISDSEDGDWKFSNTGSGSRGDAVDPMAEPAYVRVLDGGPVSGGIGPGIEFTSLSALLDAAPAQAGSKAVAIWAGVSPLSLSEALIVWNQPIVLLDKDGVSGGTGDVAVAGRLMVVSLSSPVGLDGSAAQQISIAQGTVGVYGDGNSNCDDVYGVTGGILFAEQLCSDGCPQEIANPNLVFGVNDAINIQASTVQKFKMEKCTVGLCQKDCPVWYVCMAVFGSTMPYPILPLDELAEIDTTDVGQAFSQQNILGSLVTGAGCCQSASVQIAGSGGPIITISGQWSGKLPGIAGQSVIVYYKSKTRCDGSTCETTFDGETGDLWVEEAFVKTIERQLPVSFFDAITISTTDIRLPKEVELELVDDCKTFEIRHMDGDPTTAQAVTSVVPVALADCWVLQNVGATDPSTDTIWAWTSDPSPTTEDILHLGGSLDRLVTWPFGTFSEATEYDELNKFVRSFSTTMIDVCISGSISSIQVVTDIVLADSEPLNVPNLAPGPFVTSTNGKIFDTAPESINVLNPGTSTLTGPTDVVTSVGSVKAPFVTGVPSKFTNVVTECEKDNVTIATIDPNDAPVKLAKVDDEAIVPTPAKEPDCDTRWKLIGHPGQLLWPKVLEWIPIPCGPGEGCTPSISCVTVPTGHDAESECMNLLVARPLYVSRNDSNGTHETCPGYDCSAEAPISPPSGTDVPGGEGGPVVCTTSLRRPWRRPFVQCRS